MLAQPFGRYPPALYRRPPATLRGSTLTLHSPSFSLSLLASSSPRQQHERSYQKQRNIFENKKRVLGAKVKGSELRFVKSVGLGFKTPREVRWRDGPVL